MPQPAPVDSGTSTNRPGRKQGKPKVPRNLRKGLHSPASKMLQQIRKQPHASTAKPISLSRLLQSAHSPLRKSGKKREADSGDSILDYIKCIMYTFGDVQEPLEPAAAAVLDALTAQMKLAYRIAARARSLRNAEDPKIQVVDIVATYSHDFPLLFRVYKRLVNRSEGRRAARDVLQTDVGDKVIRELGDALEQNDRARFVEASAPEYVDPLYRSRLVTMDQQTRKMDRKEYLLFHKARSTSFVSSAAARRVFQESMSKNRLLGLSSSAIELLSTIAYETVARITETASQIRGTDERPPPKSCKPKFRNPILCEGNEGAQGLVPQIQLRRYEQFGLDREDIDKAVKKLIDEAAQNENHGIEDLKDIRLF